MIDRDVNVTHPLLALVVDDEDTARMIARRQLERIGFSVHDVADGVAALAALDALRPDVVLLDVEMDPLDGFAVCERMRRLPAMANTPIIMLTAHDDAESIDRAFLVGANDFASKPINWSLLQHRLRYVMLGAQTISELAAAQRIAGMGSWRWSIADGFTRWSEGMQRLSGIDVPTNANVLARVHPDDKQQLVEALGRVSKGESMDLIHRMTRPGAADRTVEHRAEPMMAHSGEIVGLTGTVNDVTQRETALQNVQRLAFSDEVTNLPNRRAFRERLDQAIERAAGRGGELAVLYLDMDDFKRVNDSLGHSTGDRLLQAVALRLSDTVRRGDISASLDTGAHAARFGGDEFAVLLESIDDVADAEAVAARIVQAMSRPIVFDDRELTVTPSIGIAIYPRDALDSENLLTNADAAMYAAKRHGKNGHRRYDAALSDEARARLVLENELRGALHRGELSLHYQPQISVRSCAVVGVEALLRWRSTALGNIGPIDFIPLAEQTGLIVPIGDWVMTEACTQFGRWRRCGISVPRIAVNISMRQFGQADFEDRVASILQQTRMQPKCLELEITESMLASNVDSAVAKLHRLKSLGVEISIDDFGTGYSSLSYLKDFPIDRLKIDQSFVRDIDRDTNDIAITTAIVGLARGLQLDVIAEGVETDGHLEKLRELGCDEAQGYLMTRPLPGQDFVEWVQRHEQRLDAGVVQKVA